MFLALLRPRRLVALAVVVVALLVAADVGARVAAQDELAARAKSATSAQSASASISGFPFLWHLLAQGTVGGVHLHLSGVPVGTLTLGSVDVELGKTVIDRAALLSARSVRLKSIATATATVTVTAAELSSAVGDTVSLPGGGQILVDVANRTVPAAVSIVQGHILVLSVANVALLSSDLTTSPLVPACGLDVTVGTGQLAVGCTVSPVPLRLLQAVAGA